MKITKRIKNIIVWKMQEFINKNSWFVKLCKYIWNREWLVITILFILTYIVAFFGLMLLSPNFEISKISFDDFIFGGTIFGWFVWWIFPIYLIIKNDDKGDSEYLYWYDEPILDWDSLKVEVSNKEREISFDRFDHYK